jgi:3-hydroxyisobutyrate dehydrogenase
MRIGFIGLGTMGGAMAASLQRRGHDLVVSDVRPDAARELLDAGAAWAGSPAAIADLVEVVLTSLPGPDEFEDVALGPGGLVQSVRPGTVIVDLSTNSPKLLKRAHHSFAQRGVQLLDAPVSGGAPRARDGTLTLWVGGDEHAFETVKPALDAIGSQVLYMGPIGNGTVVKLVNNSVAIAINQVLMEGLTLGTKAGVEPKRLWEVLGRGSLGQLRIVDRMAALFLRQVEPVGFRLGLAQKDVLLARELAAESGVPLRLIDAAYSELVEAVNAGLADQDVVASTALQERRANTDIVLTRAELESDTDR